MGTPLILSLTSVLDGGGWLTTHLGYFTSEKETSGKGWTGAKNLNLAWVRTPNHLARSEASPSYTVMLDSVASIYENN